MWGFIIRLAITLIISYALAPKTPKREKVLPEEVTVPTAEEGLPIPVVFGKVKLSSPNVLWYGSLYTSAIKSKGGK